MSWEEWRSRHLVRSADDKSRQRQGAPGNDVAAPTLKIRLSMTCPHFKTRYAGTEARLRDCFRTTGLACPSIRALSRVLLALPFSGALSGPVRVSNVPINDREWLFSADFKPPFPHFSGKIPDSITAQPHA
jgi:hypothetical protein